MISKRIWFESKDHYYCFIYRETKLFIPKYLLHSAFPDLKLPDNGVVWVIVENASPGRFRIKGSATAVRCYRKPELTFDFFMCRDIWNELFGEEILIESGDVKTINLEIRL